MIVDYGLEVSAVQHRMVATVAHGKMPQLGTIPLRLV